MTTARTSIMTVRSGDSRTCKTIKSVDTKMMHNEGRKHKSVNWKNHDATHRTPSKTLSFFHIRKAEIPRTQQYGYVRVCCRLAGLQASGAFVLHCHHFRRYLRTSSLLDPFGFSSTSSFDGRRDSDVPDERYHSTRSMGKPDGYAPSFV